MEEFDGMIEMNGQEFAQWLRTFAEKNPDSVFVIKMETNDEIPHEAYDMDKKIHFRRQCPHHNLHGTRDVELELHGRDVVMRGWHNGEKMHGLDGEWPVVQRCLDDDDALRLYLHARQGFVINEFEIVDA